AISTKARSSRSTCRPISAAASPLPPICRSSDLRLQTTTPARKRRRFYWRGAPLSCRWKEPGSRFSGERGDRCNVIAVFVAFYDHGEIARHVALAVYRRFELTASASEERAGSPLSRG